MLCDLFYALKNISPRGDPKGSMKQGGLKMGLWSKDPPAGRSCCINRVSSDQLPRGRLEEREHVVVLCRQAGPVHP